MIFFFFKKFEKVEKTGIISTKFSLRCTPSLILGFPHVSFMWLLCWLLIACSKAQQRIQSFKKSLLLYVINKPPVKSTYSGPIHCRIPLGTQMV